MNNYRCMSTSSAEAFENLTKPNTRSITGMHTLQPRLQKISYNLRKEGICFMKNRIVSMILVVVMLFSLGIFAFADDASEELPVDSVTSEAPVLEETDSASESASEPVIEEGKGIDTLPAESIAPESDENTVSDPTDGIAPNIEEDAVVNPTIGDVPNTENTESGEVVIPATPDESIEGDGENEEVGEPDSSEPVITDTVTDAENEDSGERDTISEDENEIALMAAKTPYDNFVSTFKKFLSSADDQCTINLTSSIALKATDNFVIPAGKQLTINLDGFTLSRQGGSGYLFTVEPEGTLIIGTSNMTPGTIDVGSSGLALLSRGSIGVYNGSIFGDLATESNGHLTVNCGAGRFSDSDAVFKYLSNAASGMKRVIFVDKNSIYEPRNYSGLMMAFEEVSDSNTKILLADDFEEGIIVESGKNVDIDLNGYTITQAWYESTIEIESGATITIRDSVGTGKIVSDYSSGTVIDNKGSLTIVGSVILTHTNKNSYLIENNGLLKMSELPKKGTVNGKVVVDGVTYNYPEGTVSTAVARWVESNGKKYYEDENGIRVKGLHDIIVNGKLKTFYFSVTDAHMMKNGWIRANDGYYWADADGHILKGGRFTRSGKSYYVDKDGRRVTGIVTIDSKQYYFSDSDGHMKKGGWVAPGDGYYYWADTDGHFMKGGMFTRNDKTYYVDKQGRRITGLLKIQGKNYYFSANDGRLLKNTWVLVNGVKKYYAGTDGVITKIL